jgi:NAD-reducing hydrogenase large subunit
MSQIIKIDPITRIEGHARISIYLDAAGRVNDAQLHVTQLRGFEKLAQGRPFREMPALTARICGICPVSHLLASAKACDELLGVSIPQTAVMLRRLVNYAQMVQSHALSFFYLSAPDLLLGMDTPIAERNIVGLAKAAPDLARDGIRLRQFGQNLIEGLGGKRIHNAWVIGGGVTEPLKAEVQEDALAKIPEMLGIIESTIEQFRAILPHFAAEIETFANFLTMYMGLISAQNSLEYYDGRLRLVNENGETVSDIDRKAYADKIGEAVESFSYLKSPYYLPMGYPAGIYRVGALARLQVAKSCGTPLADAELARFRNIPKTERQSSFYYHYARLIEILHGLERIQSLLQEPNILSPDVRVHGEIVNEEGIGIIEAPRGTLIHHYQIDKNGLITDMNLIVSTGHNVLAMNRGIKQAAQKFVDAGKLEEGMLNRVEAVIRAFDPCLSCATHAVGQMPLHIQVLAVDGNLVKEIRR